MFSNALVGQVAKAHEEVERGYGGYGSVAQGYYERPYYGYYEMQDLRGYKKRAAGSAELYAAPTPEMVFAPPIRFPIAARHILGKRSAHASNIVAEPYAAPAPEIANSGGTVHVPAHRIGKRAASLMRLDPYYAPDFSGYPGAYSPIRRPIAKRAAWYGAYAEPVAELTPEVAPAGNDVNFRGYYLGTKKTRCCPLLYI